MYSLRVRSTIEIDIWIKTGAVRLLDSIIVPTQRDVPVIVKLPLREFAPIFNLNIRGHFNKRCREKFIGWNFNF